MQRLKIGSRDLAKENIKKLAKIFPNVIKEERVDFELLKQMLSDCLIDGCKERYGLNWVGKRESILKANTPLNKTLRPIVEKSIDFEKTKNLYIEGDNFEALKIIQESYLGKIKMIYIDPPYNTGKDFIYKDNFKQSKEEYEEEIEAVDEEGVKLYKNTDSNGRFHSDWLSMMYERLLISRDLLKDDGVIFISIDDNEVHNLRHICDEVFGEGNFVAQFVWKSKLGKVGTTTTISITHEYILCYAKDFTKINFKMIEKYSEERKENLRQWGQADRMEDRPSMYYPIIINKKEVYPIKEDGTKGRWRVGKEKAEELLKNNLLELFEKNGKYYIYRKFPKNISKIPYDTLLIDIGTTAKGTLSLQALDLNNFFDYPKPVELLKFFIELSNSQNDIILDFFSGSATTAHAVMELNAEDNGNRQFIMIQIPEIIDEKSEAYKAGFRTICDIARERIIRAGNKLRIENAELRIDTGFRYLKVDSSNFKEIKDINEFTQDNLFETVDIIKPDRDELDLLFEVILELGYELTLEIKTKKILGKKVYFVQNSLIACFDENLDETLAKELSKLKPHKIVLKDSSFKSDSDKINFEQTIKELSPESDIWVV